MALTRVALGRTEKLGSLYDARSDSFHSATLVNAMETTMIESYDLDSQSSEMLSHYSLTNNAKCLAIELELQASVLSGLANIKRLGKYILEKKPSTIPNFISMVLVYKWETVHEEILLRQLKDCADMSVLQENSQSATHVVVGVDWGLYCTITCEHEDNRETKETIRTIFEMFRGVLDDTVKRRKNSTIDDAKSFLNDFEFVVKSDLLSVNSTSPVKFSEAVALLKSLPEALAKKNRGKGLPLVYQLKPLDQIIKLCKLDIPSCLYKSISEAAILTCVELFEDIIRLNEEVKTMKNLLSHCEFNDDNTSMKLDAIGNKLQLHCTDYRNKLKTTLFQVRSGQESESTLIKHLTDFQTKFQQLKLELKQFELVKDKLDRASELQNLGYTLMTKNNENLLDTIETGYILYTNDLFSCNCNNVTFQIFSHLFTIHGSNHTSFSIVLKEYSPERFSSLPESVEMIHYYKNRNLIHDYVAEMVLSEKIVCPVELVSSSPVRKPPVKKVIIRLMFDNQFYTDEEYKPVWICSKCRSHVEYGLDTKLLHCVCGESNPKLTKFCSTEILKYSDDREGLCARIESLPEPKEINVLILGETGVGKSTWINGIFNYFLYENLEEACRNDLNAPIPSKFQVGGRTINVGEKSINENPCDTGESCTKGPRRYTMIHDNYQINVIDTPGVGDSRGIEQDKANFDNILAFLTNYESLHGVCILMKPNNNRNTLWFRFCIEELLTHLHSSIVKNIVFCFTNARQTFYQPGDTLPILKEYLKNRKISLDADPERNCFCFDNEAFRYLACIKNDVTCLDERFSSFDESWNTARKETLRLIDYVRDLIPHQIDKTISLNSAREAVLQIAKPLAEMVNHIIPDNIRSLENAKESLNNNNDEIGMLEKVLTVEGKSFQVIPLDFPRTVCTGEGCWRFETGGIDFCESRKVYHQICHYNCSIQGLPTEAANDERLLQCEAFKFHRTQSLLDALQVTNIFDVPGYHTYECTDPKCKSSEGQHHWHYDYDHEAVRKRVNTDQWKDIWRDCSDECRLCGHTYKLHMHITYDLETVSETFIKPEIQEQIRGKTTEKERLEALANELEENVKELENEREIMFNSQVKFGAFIKRNALIPYNDAYEELMIMYIKDEQAKGRIKNEELIEKMTTDLEIYRLKKQAIDSAIGSGESDEIQSANLTPDIILSNVEQLKKLKRSGQILTDALEGIISAKQGQHNRMIRLQQQEEQNRNVTVVMSPTQKKGNLFSRAFKFTRKFLTFR